MVVLHTALLAACLIEVLALHRPFIPPSAGDAAVVLAAARLAVVVHRHLGWQWNTRVVVVPGARGSPAPYRILPHPNSSPSALEGVALPLVHTAWITALAFHGAERGAQWRRGIKSRRCTGESDVIDCRRRGGRPARDRAARSAGGSGGGGRRAARGSIDKAWRGRLDAAHRRSVGTARSPAAGQPLAAITYLDRSAVGQCTVPLWLRPGRAQTAFTPHRGCRGRAGVRVVQGEVTDVTRTRSRFTPAGCERATSPQPMGCTRRSVGRWA